MDDNSSEDKELQYANEKVPISKVNRYEEIRKQAEAVYKTFGKVMCPALRNKEVSFTSEGFNHLVYRIKKQEREKVYKFCVLSSWIRQKSWLRKAPLCKNTRSILDRQKSDEERRKFKLW